MDAPHSVFRGFVAILNQRDGRPDETVAGPVLARLAAAGPVRTAREGPCVVAASQGAGPGAARLVVARMGAGVAVGIVRLDEPPASHPVSPAVDRRDVEPDDLVLVLDAVRAQGAFAPERLTGDFAFAVYDPGRHELIAARDAFGVKALFYAEREGHLLVASHASLLAAGKYDDEYIARFLLANVTWTARTMYADVRRVPPGGFVVGAVRGGVRAARYWAPRPAANAPRRLSDAAECFRERFTACVRNRIDRAGTTWSELSGGLDSSSIVVTAHHLARTGAVSPLVSTITYVDSLGDGDEQSFAHPVLAQVGLPQVVLSDDWPWRDDGEPPPPADEPSPFFPFFARERRAARAVVDAGGRVLLGGLGSDHYLNGSAIWLADLLASGRILEAARGCVAVAAAHRTSLWRTARRYALEPLLPRMLRYAGARASQRLPPWIPEAFVRRHDLRGALSFMRVGRSGSRFHDAITIELEAIEHAVRYKVFAEPLELRFPFLDRALVELALALPRDCIRQPGLTKVVLRESMRGRLPEVVRQRSTKGGIDARILWTLSRERVRIDALVRQSCLADMGAIDPQRLQRAVEDARRGHVVNTAFLLSVLALETWLAVQNGRWQIGDPVHPETFSDAA